MYREGGYPDRERPHLEKAQGKIHLGHAVDKIFKAAEKEMADEEGDAVDKYIAWFKQSQEKRAPVIRRDDIDLRSERPQGAKKNEGQLIFEAKHLPTRISVLTTGILGSETEAKLLDKVEDHFNSMQKCLRPGEEMTRKWLSERFRQEINV